MKENSSVKMMVYGTLKKSFRNYHFVAPYCLSINKIQFWGRLYNLPNYKCPAVQFHTSFAKGLPDYEKNAQIFSEINNTEKPQDQKAFLKKPDGDWDLLEGELFELKQGSKVLPMLDSLESSFGSGDLCYDRVLISCLNQEGKVNFAWAYQIRTLYSQAVRCTQAVWQPLG